MHIRKVKKFQKTGQEMLYLRNFIGKVKITFLFSVHFALLFGKFPLVLGLSLRNVTIPEYGMMGGSALLSCDFSLLPSDKLLFVKWYKNDEEFYRFTPASMNPTITFPLEGVSVQLSKSNLNQVVLRNLTLKTSGVYKCEAMAEDTFQAPFAVGSMAIIAPPESLPVIIGVPSVVNVDERIIGNCTSYRSKPSASLTVYIDDVVLDNSDITEYKRISEPNGLETSVVGFNFVAERHQHKRGYIELKCTATILNLYWIKTLNVSLANYNILKSYSGESQLGSSGAAFGNPQILRIFIFAVFWNA